MTEALMETTEAPELFVVDPLHFGRDDRSEKVAVRVRGATSSEEVQIEVTKGL
jgi:hypothetical protein